MTLDLSIIIPTRDEESNIVELLAQIETATEGLRAEVVVVDDSDDDTEAVARSVAERSPLRINVVHRSIEARWGGLGGAVCDGLSVSEGIWAVVMDGDLQHPPAVICDLLVQARVTGADIVVASRYIADGDAAGLAGPLRRAVSRASVVVTRGLFPVRLHRCTDPMSGFFLFRTSAVDAGVLAPRGYKILLEILARHRLQVSEVPFRFADRRAGVSKARAAEGFHLVRQLGRLRLTRKATSNRVIDLRPTAAEHVAQARR